MSNNKKKIIILSFTIMFMIGVVNNIRGQVGPYIMDDFGLNYSRLGFLLSFISIGSMIVYFISGKLIEKFGLLKIIFYGIIHNILALIFVFLSANYYALIFSLFLVGAGVTILSISAINLTSISYSKKRGKMINLLHLFYGAGGMIAPYFVTLVLKLGFSWNYSFLFSIILLLIIFFEFNSASLPEIESGGETVMRATSDLIKEKKVILFSLIVFFQVGVEFSLVTWLAPFLKDVEERTDLMVSFYLSLFFITFTLGRFLASFIVEKIGYYNYLIYTGGTAALLISFALIGGYSFTILIPLSGLFLAGQVPTLQAAILDSFGGSGIKVVGFAQTAGMVGLTVLSNWVVGFINDFIAIEAGFIFLVIILTIAMTITYYLKKITQHETAEYKS
ncbi:fucose permease [Halanaerobium saccharolyticum]|uniref:Fucose permease n=1 Tax=Halanaerobium saccharolyticum TaxID=43595 RepID=A0A4R7Z2Q5_9FIRM|nr:MFS transporter [Halanaerobium saccharolyticum]RAK07847.1 fucose permease [Halanaerobium saccharolyticum]TDW04461.1 fucose permease [Halanaerobium saccharolyticum]TDX59797.1 fucose permease [Halanaerobium saccharolyticum]